MEVPLKSPDNMEERLLGKLSLDKNETATGVLVARLDTKEVVFSQNVSDPQSSAAIAYNLYSSAQSLDTSHEDVLQKKTTPQNTPLLIRIEGPAHPTRRYKAISSDGTYLLYVEVETV